MGVPGPSEATALMSPPPNGSISLRGSVHLAYSPQILRQPGRLDAHRSWQGGIGMSRYV